MGKEQPYPVLFQGIEDRVHQICLGSKFDVVTGILGDLAEEVIRILGPFCRGGTGHFWHGIPAQR